MDDDFVPHSSQCGCVHCCDSAIQKFVAEATQDGKAKVMHKAEQTIAALAQKLAERAHEYRLRSEQCLELSRSTRFSRSMPLHAQKALVNLLEASLAYL
jgi:hypothetical protein